MLPISGTQWQEKDAKMIPVAGNIQTARKNGLSQNYPFRRDEDDQEQYNYRLPPTEYDEKYTSRRYERKPLSKRDIQREQLRKDITQMVIKEHYEKLHRQEAERMPLRKQPNYYMTRDSSREPQYSLYKTDDMMTFWSHGARTNSARRRNTNFTKPIGEQLDQQFG